MEFLARAKESLKPNGVIIIKDNMARQGCKLDPIDSSIIRHLDIMKSIIQKAGLTILDVEKQEGFPEVIVPVWMIAMRWPYEWKRSFYSHFRLHALIYSIHSIVKMHRMFNSIWLS